MKKRTLAALSLLLALPTALLAAAAANAGGPVATPYLTLDSATDCTWDNNASPPEVCVVPDIPTVNLGSTIYINLPNNGFARHSGPFNGTLTTSNGVTVPSGSMDPDLDAYTEPNETLTVHIPTSLPLATDLGSNYGVDTLHDVWWEDPGYPEVDFTLRFRLQRDPAAPAAVTSKRINATSATLTWAAPKDDGGLPITNYVAEATSSTGTVVQVCGSAWNPSARSCTFTGLKSGAAYTLSVQAANQAYLGNGIVKSVIPASTTAMNAPASFSAVRSADTAATMMWNPPAVLGGKKITGYRVSRDGSGANGGGAYTTVVSASARSFTMHYLVEGDTYNLSVQPLFSGGAGQIAKGAVFMG